MTQSVGIAPLQLQELAAPTPVVINVEEGDRFGVLMTRLELERGLIYNLNHSWLGSVTLPIADLGEVVAYEAGDDYANVLQDTGDAIARIGIRGDAMIGAIVQARTLEQAQAVMARIREAAPETPVKPDKLKVAFWANSLHGPSATHRTVSAPTWRKVAGNYGAVAGEALGRLIRAKFDPEEGGKLILWSGPPGTGKTFALRALLQEWRDWASAHYILDPEAFFGDASYMQKVLMQGHGDDSDMPAVPFHNGVMPTGGRRSPRRRKPKPQWKVVLLEDSGELTASNAKDRTGQGLSRLLNLCDGMIGQGLRVLVLLTTNEELGKLHPAVIRPGRCAANVRFGPLTAEEANAWLVAHGAGDAPRVGASTLAELYERIGEHQQIVATGGPAERIGFPGAA